MIRKMLFRDYTMDMALIRVLLLILYVIFLYALIVSAEVQNYLHIPRYHSKVIFKSLVVFEVSG